MAKKGKVEVTLAQAEQNEAIDQTKSGDERMRTRDKLFLGAAFLTSLIIGPYVYYASVVYNYIHEYAKE